MLVYFLPKQIRDKGNGYIGESFSVEILTEEKMWIVLRILPNLKLITANLKRRCG
jgi:hypothetical protein